MSIFARLLGMATGGSHGPLDPFWYETVGTATASGEHITAEVAEAVAAIHRGKQVIAEGVAKMPCEVFRKLPEDRKEDAPEHPVAPLLRFAPNETDTPIAFFDQVLGSAVLRGKGYAEIVSGPAGFASQLVPLDFDRVREARVRGKGKRYAYELRDDDGNWNRFPASQMFRLEGPGGGKSLLTRMRETAGSARASEAFGAEQFSKAPRMAGFLSPKQGVSMDPEALKASAEAFRAANSGRGRWNRAAVLPGLEWTSIGMNLRDAQYLELRKFTREEIAIFMGVPPHKLGVMDKASYASIEAQNRALVDDCLQPWATRLEQALAMQILAPISVARGEAPDAYFVRFNFDDLLRGTATERSEAEAKWVQNGILSRNEAREMEDRNPVEGLDEMLIPASNAQPAANSPRSPARLPGGEEPEDAEDSEAA